MTILKNGILKTCLISLLFAAINCDATTIPSSSIAFKVYPGISFSRTTLRMDENFKKKSLLGLQAEFSFNYLFKKGDILEVGLRYKMIGNKVISSEQYGGVKIINQSFSPSLSILFHKKIGTNNDNGLYLSGGGMFTKGPPEEVILGVGDTFFVHETTYLTTNKFHLLLGGRYIFNIKNRNLGIELVYTKGLNNYYQSVTHNIFNNNQNRYINKGSGLHIGLVYFFKNKRRSKQASSTQ
ncbi:MAG: hypothetical protein V4613_07150 [Bacteroidota bacterium]